MDVPTRTRSAQLLLAYLQRSTGHPGVQTTAERVSLADLAMQAGLGHDPCVAALCTLAVSGAVKVAVHEGGLLEIRVQARRPPEIAMFGTGKRQPKRRTSARPASTEARRRLHERQVDAVPPRTALAVAA